MNKVLFFNVSFITLLILIGCAGTEKDSEPEQDLQENKRTRVEYVFDENGEKESQLLILESGDTFHKIEYHDGQIVRNEGNYIHVEMSITDVDKNGLLLDVFTIEMDSMDRLLSIQEFKGPDKGYEVYSIEKIDSSLYSKQISFEQSVVDIAIGVVYGNKDSTFDRYLNPIIVDFDSKNISKKEFSNVER